MQLWLGGEQGRGTSVALDQVRGLILQRLHAWIDLHSPCRTCLQVAVNVVAHQEAGRSVATQDRRISCRGHVRLCNILTHAVNLTCPWMHMLQGPPSTYIALASDSRGFNETDLGISMRMREENIALAEDVK